MTALSDLILEDNAEVLQRMLDHPFVRGISDGTLPKPAYHRYLIYERDFVETAISIFAYATARAPDLNAKSWLIDVQQSLARDQLPYFDQSFKELAVATDIPRPPAVDAFDEGMLTIAEQGDFSEIVTAMFAAEWMYWTWCSRMPRRQILLIPISADGLISTPNQLSRRKRFGSRMRLIAMPYLRIAPV